MSRLMGVRLAQVAGMLVGLLVLSGGVAAAGGGAPRPPGRPPGGSPPAGGQKSKTVGTCVLYANPAGMGADCVTGDGSVTQFDLEKFFGGAERVCRYDPVGPNDPPPDEPDRETPGQWWIERCVERDPSGPDEGDIRYTYDHVWALAQDLPQLTEEQQQMWVHTTTAYPVPFVATFPERPRVNTDTSFMLTDPPERHPDFVRTERVYAGPGHGYVTMKAEVAKTTFTVEQPDGDPVFKEAPCARYFAVLTRHICTNRFLHSSAIFGDDGSYEEVESPNKYFVNTELVWQVTYQTDTNQTWQTLGEFDVQLGRWLRVNEIQTLNR